MRLLNSGLASGETSNVFRTTVGANVHVELYGTFSSQTVTMQRSYDQGAAYLSYVTDATAETWTTQDHRIYRLPPGGYFRFVCSSGGSPSITIRVEGPGTTLL